MNQPGQKYSSSRVEIAFGRKASALLLILLIVAFGFRTVGGLDWDQGTHLHPDERFLTMVASAVRSPDSLALYLDTATSSLNPYNQGYQDFFYGTLPLFAVRYVAEWSDATCAAVRRVVEHLDEDRPLFNDHNNMKAAVERCDILAAVEAEIGDLGSSWVE